MKRKHPYRDKKEVYAEILSLFLQNGGKVKNTERAIRHSANLDYLNAKTKINFLVKQGFLAEEEESGEVFL